MIRTRVSGVKYVDGYVELQLSEEEAKAVYLLIHNLLYKNNIDPTKPSEELTFPLWYNK